MNTLKPEMHQDSNFSQLYDAIEKRMKEGSGASPTQTAKDTKTADVATHPGDNVSASNGSIGVGNIDIGGDVSGNIVIGNNNQVSDMRKKKK